MNMHNQVQIQNLESNLNMEIISQVTFIYSVNKFKYCKQERLFQSSFRRAGK